MARVDAHPLRCADLLARLRRCGIETRPGRGSHIILIRPALPGGVKGPTYPVSCHNPGAEISVHIVRVILRRFQIPEEGVLLVDVCTRYSAWASPDLTTVAIRGRATLRAA